MGNHMSYGITQCNLPPGSGDFPAFTPAETGTRFSDPEGYKVELDVLCFGANLLICVYFIISLQSLLCDFSN